MSKATQLLSDQQMKAFIQNGYLKLTTGFPDQVHQQIHRQVEQMFDQHGNLGNNMLPLIPDIQKIFDHPVLHGALTGILGSNYVMHSHRYCHLNPPESSGQSFHKDSYEGDVSATHHRCRWVMAFYYPQDTPEMIGPTAILPGTQYYDTSEAAHRQPELVLSGQAGAVTLVHYDLWHRAMPNSSQRKRYMLKFLFYRLDEPTTPSWNHQQADWEAIAPENGQMEHNLMWRKLWDWYRGESSPDNGSTSGPLIGRESESKLSSLIKQLRTGEERVQLDAAYALGGEPVVSELIDLLPDESVGRYAAYALGASDATVVPALTEALADPDDTVRANAAYALGDIGSPAQTATHQLAQALTDDSAPVRRNAAEALGTTGQIDDSIVPALASLLHDEQYWVRDNAARTLAKMGTAAESAVSALQCALNDENRYVRFNVAMALKQIGTSMAHQVLFDNLFMSRWCPLTTRDSSF